MGVFRLERAVFRLKFCISNLKMKWIMGYSSDAELYRLGLRVWQDCPRREEAGL